MSSHSTRILATFRLFVSLTNPESTNAYNKYCDEMEKDKRAGICNVSKDLGKDVIYILPPSLKKSITALRFLPDTGSEVGVLYGIAIVRTQGPDEYVHTFPEYVTEKDILAMQTGTSGTPPLTPSTSLPSASSATSSSTSISPVASSTSSSSSLPQRPVGAFGVGTLGSGTSFGMGPVSFSMGGIPAPQNVPSVLTAPAPTPVPVPVPVAAPVSPALLETIKKVAQFCASNGASTISMLKKKDGAINVMPFLFEGQAGYETFLSTLKTCLGMAAPSVSLPSSSSSSAASAGASKSAPKQ